MQVPFQGSQRVKPKKENSKEKRERCSVLSFMFYHENILHT